MAKKANPNSFLQDAEADGLYLDGVPAHADRKDMARIILTDKAGRRACFSTFKFLNEVLNRKGQVHNFRTVMPSCYAHV